MLQRSGEKLCIVQRAVRKIERKSSLPTRPSRPGVYCDTKIEGPPRLRMSDTDLSHQAKRGFGRRFLIGGMNKAAAVSLCGTTVSVVWESSLQVHRDPRGVGGLKLALLSTDRSNMRPDTSHSRS